MLKLIHMEDEKYVNVKYDKIGLDYNLTRKADKYLTAQLLYPLKPIKDGKYLDIRC